MPKTLTVTLAVTLAAALAGCGSSSKSSSTTTPTTSSAPATTTSTTTGGSSPLRQVFLATLRNGLQTSNLPPDYTACVIARANSQVSNEEVARLAALPQAQRSTAGQRVGRDLGRQCIAQGAGLSTFRQIFLRSISSSLASSSLPASYRACVSHKAAQLPNSELTSLFSDYVNGKGLGSARAEALGRRLGQQCLRK